MAPVRGNLLPFYLVVDVSASMTLDGRIQAVAKMLPSIVDAIAKNPIIADKVRFAMIDFAEDARVQLPLCDVLDEHLTLPSLTTRGLTSYAAAFDLLRTDIDDNVTQLKADGYAVHRPVAFLLTDGQPTDKEPVWRAAHDRLITSAYHPNLVPCGVADADPVTLLGLIHPSEGPRAMQMYLMDKGEDPAEAITAIAELLIASVVATVESMNKGQTGAMLPPANQVGGPITGYPSSFDPKDFL